MGKPSGFVVQTLSAGFSKALEQFCPIGDLATVATGSVPHTHHVHLVKQGGLVLQGGRRASAAWRPQPKAALGGEHQTGGRGVGMELRAVRATSHTGAFRTQCPGRVPCGGGRWHSQWPKALTYYLQLFSSAREKLPRHLLIPGDGVCSRAMSTGTLEGARRAQRLPPEHVWVGPGNDASRRPT